MATGITCCYKCPDRVIACHDRCEKYQAQKAEYERLKAEDRKNRPPLIKCGDFYGDSGLGKRHRR